MSNKEKNTIGKEAPIESKGDATMPDASMLCKKDILIVGGDVEATMPKILRRLLEAADLPLGVAADKIKTRAPHLSRWLADTRRNQLPLWALARLAKEIGRQPVIFLPKKEIAGRADSRLVELGLQIAYLGRNAGLSDFAHAIAGIFGARSSLHVEDPIHNILSWRESGDVSDPQLLKGAAWSSDLSVRAIEAFGDNGVSDTAPYLAIEWKDAGSTFARREGVKSFVVIPVHLADGVSAVLFLNFSRQLSSHLDTGESGKEDQAMALAAEQFRLAVERLSKGLTRQLEASTVRQFVRQHSPGLFADLLGVLKLAAETSGGTLDKNLAGALCALACKTLSADPGMVCSVFAPTQSVNSPDSKPIPIERIATTNPDHRPAEIVERAIKYGESFYAESLPPSVRLRYDPTGAIAPQQHQFCVVPIRASTFLDPGHGKGLVEVDAHSAGRASSRTGQIAYRCMIRPSDRERFLANAAVKTWGALACASAISPLSSATFQQLLLASHLAAEIMYLRECSTEKMIEPGVRTTLGHLTEGIPRVVKEWSELLDRRASDPQPTRTPFDSVAELAMERAEDFRIRPAGKRIGGRSHDLHLLRVEIFPYDHVRKSFRSELAGKAIVPGIDRSIFPRKGGMTETLLGVDDSYIVIPNVKDHPRVNARTGFDPRITGLIGCTCRTDMSFRAEAILWLAFGSGRKDEPKKADYSEADHLPPDILIRDGYSLFLRIRALAHIVGLLTAGLRWWGPWNELSQDRSTN